MLDSVFTLARRFLPAPPEIPPEPVEPPVARSDDHLFVREAALRARRQEPQDGGALDRLRHLEAETENALHDTRFSPVIGMRMIESLEAIREAHGRPINDSERVELRRARARCYVEAALKAYSEGRPFPWQRDPRSPTPEAVLDLVNDAEALEALSPDVVQRARNALG
ncbi:MAG: hypothetical protein AAF658_17255 [Myxococcota bacterium]